MFYTTDLSSDGWDGTYKGNPMPEGTYVFTAKITDFAGRTFDRSGTIVLLRK
jgi:gliding motility-associated-like protein